MHGQTQIKKKEIYLPFGVLSRNGAVIEFTIFFKGSPL
jgi:hypothetical protein